MFFLIFAEKVIMIGSIKFFTSKGKWCWLNLFTKLRFMIILIIFLFLCKHLCSNSSLLKIFTDTLWNVGTRTNIFRVKHFSILNRTWSWTNKSSGEILHQSHDQHIRICHLSVITNSWSAAQCYKIFLTNDDNSDILCVLNHNFDLCEILEMPILKLQVKLNYW